MVVPMWVFLTFLSETRRDWQSLGGGLAATANRTNWPVNGGGIAIQPGWFTGHASALFYVNLGLGTSGPQGGPPNESFPLLPPFQIDGPSNNPYPGTFCLPQIPIPANMSVKVGDLATIQVIETAVHGGALYNVSLALTMKASSFHRIFQNIRIWRLINPVRWHNVRGRDRCYPAHRNQLFQ